MHKELKESTRKAIENYNKDSESFNRMREVFSGLIKAMLDKDVNRINNEINNFIEDLVKSLIYNLEERSFGLVAIKILSMPLLSILVISMSILVINSIISPILDFLSAKELIGLCIGIAVILAVLVMIHRESRGDSIEPSWINVNLNIDKLLVRLSEIFTYEFVSRKIVRTHHTKRSNAESSTIIPKPSIKGTFIYDIIDVIYTVMQYIMPSTIINALESGGENSNGSPSVQRVLLTCVDCKSSGKPYDICYEEFSQFITLQFPGTQYLFVNKSGEWESLTRAFLRHLGFSDNDIGKIFKDMDENRWPIGNRVYKLKFATWLHKLLINAITNWRFVTICASSTGFGFAYVIPFSLLFKPKVQVALQQGRNFTNRCENSASVIFVEANGACANQALVALIKALQEVEIYKQ